MSNQESSGAIARLVSRSVSGALAGLLATGVMSLVMLGAKRVGALGEPPPRRLVRRATALLGPAAPRGKALDAAAVAAHFGFGAAVGALYGLLPPRVPTGKGVGLGLAVWAVNYAGWLPQVGLMPPARRDRPGRPTSMILAHIAYGLALVAAHRRLRTNADVPRLAPEANG